MSTHLPTLRQLQYLIAVAEEGHFGRAAQNCFVTQSTLSAGIQELEAILGITVIERTKRRVAITPLGQELVDRARRVLAEVEDMRQRIGQVRARLAAASNAGGVDLTPLGRQKGMFAMLPVSKEQVQKLREEHGVYMAGSGRINVAGLTMGNIDAHKTSTRF